MGVKDRQLAKHTHTHRAVKQFLDTGGGVEVSMDFPRFHCGCCCVQTRTRTTVVVDEESRHSSCDSDDKKQRKGRGKSTTEEQSLFSRMLAEIREVLATN